MQYSQPILIAGLLLGLAIASTLVARRARVPGLVVFLLLGILAGPDELGLVSDPDLDAIQTIGIVALALILFEGGFTSEWREIRPVIGSALSLATVGTLLTATITGLVTAWLLDFSTLHAMLIGGIVASTDGAAVFALLRRSTLKKKLARTLEAEAGLNDPVAILLVIGFIEWLSQPDYGVVEMAQLFVKELGIGGVVGLAVGWSSRWLIRRLDSTTTGLFPVATMAAAAVTFGLAQVLHGSGFLAVYLAGLVLGSGPLPAKRTVTDFHDGVAWVSQITMFLVLGLLFVPSSLGGLWDEALLVTLVLMFVARPVAVAVSTLFSGLQRRELLLLQWAGMRGAVPIVLATFPLHEHISDSNQIYNIVFFVVLASAILQGTTFEWLASRLKLTTSEPAVNPAVIEVGNIRKLGAEFFEFVVSEDDAIAGHVVAELQLPREALVSVIVRGDDALLPRGSTELEPGDRLHILLRGHLAERVEELFDLWHDGPIGTPELLPRPIITRPAIFSIKPWDQTGSGTEDDPIAVGSVAVARRLRTRNDATGVLFLLVDGRYGVTGGGTCAIGSARQLRGYAVRRIERAETLQERAWWQEVAGAVA